MGEKIVADGPFLSPAADTAGRCPLELALQIMDDRWKILIVWRLFWGARPFCELMRSTSGITKKTLRKELVDMERYGLIQKEVRAGADRKAAYRLTPLGEALKPTVGALYQWGLHFLSAPAGRNSSYDAGALAG